MSTRPPNSPPPLLTRGGVLLRAGLLALLAHAAFALLVTRIDLLEGGARFLAGQGGTWLAILHALLVAATFALAWRHQRSRLGSPLRMAFSPMGQRVFRAFAIAAVVWLGVSLIAGVAFLMAGWLQAPVMTWFMGMAAGLLAGARDWRRTGPPAPPRAQAPRTGPGIARRIGAVVTAAIVAVPALFVSWILCGHTPFGIAAVFLVPLGLWAGYDAFDKTMRGVPLRRRRKVTWLSMLRLFRD